MDLVSITKALLQTLKDVEFSLLFAHMKSVCTQYEINIPHMNTSYKATNCSCQKQGLLAVYQHYYCDIFNSAIVF